MLLDFQYVFDGYPPQIQEGTFLALIITSIFFILVAIVLKYLIVNKKKVDIDKYQREFYTKLVNWLFTGGIVNLFLIYFRKFRIPYLQMRFVLLVWWGILLIWFITIIQHYLIKIPKLRAEDQKRKEYEKYLK